MLVLAWFPRKQSLRQRFLCKYFTEEHDFREEEWEMGSEAGKNVIWNWPQLSAPGCWIQDHLRSHRKTLHGWGEKERSIFHWLPTPVGQRLSPWGNSPTFLSCPCMGAEWVSPKSQAMALTEKPEGEWHKQGTHNVRLQL